MLTMEDLKAFGADTDEGLARCLGNEAFYLKMVGMGIVDERFENLGPVLKEGDLDQAFEMVHALKGVLGNLALTPIYNVINEMTEKLRAREKADYMPLYDEMMEKRAKLLELI